MMTRNVGRRPVGFVSAADHETDATWEAYCDALPGTTAQVAERVGVSFRRAEQSLGLMRRMGKVSRPSADWWELAPEHE
jgi:hypothetical protein